MDITSFLKATSKNAIPAKAGIQEPLSPSESYTYKPLVGTVFGNRGLQGESKDNNLTRTGC